MTTDMAMPILLGLVAILVGVGASLACSEYAQAQRERKRRLKMLQDMWQQFPRAADMDRRREKRQAEARTMITTSDTACPPSPEPAVFDAILATIPSEPSIQHHSHWQPVTHSPSHHDHSPSHSHCDTSHSHSSNFDSHSHSSFDSGCHSSGHH